MAKPQPLLVSPVGNPKTTPSEQLARGEPSKAGGAVGHRAPVRKLGGGGDPAFERFLMEHRGRRGPTSGQGKRGARYFGYTGGDYEGQTPGQGDAAAGAEWRGMDIKARRGYAQKGETDDEFGFRLDREKKRAQMQQEVAREAAKGARVDESAFAKERAKEQAKANVAAEASAALLKDPPPPVKKSIWSGIKEGVGKLLKPPVKNPSAPADPNRGEEDEELESMTKKPRLAPAPVKNPSAPAAPLEGGGGATIDERTTGATVKKAIAGGRVPFADKEPGAQPPVAKTPPPVAKTPPQSETSKRASAAAKRAAERANRGAGLGS